MESKANTITIEMCPDGDSFHLSGKAFVVCHVEPSDTIAKNGTWCESFGKPGNLIFVPDEKTNG